MHIKSLIKTSLTISLVALISACGPKITGLKQDPSFTYNAIQSGEIAIAGVVSRIKPLTETELNRNSLNLLYAIQDERNSYPITPMAAVRDALGSESFNKMTSEYASNGLLGAATISEIKGKLKQRYLIFISIDRDQQTEPRWQTLQQRKDKDGNVTQREGVRVGFSRSLSVSGTVMDLETGMTVWNGKLSTQKSATTTHPINTKSKLAQNIETISAIADLAQGKYKAKEQPSMQEQYPAPQPPALHTMLAHIYEGFADALPEKD